jgi:hypothetical protein
MTVYPTPHFEKLKATLENDKLPADDKSQVEKAIEHYVQLMKLTISPHG